MKPTILKGTRDFLPSEVLKRAYLFRGIENVFKKYGYQPIETPTMEYLKTLTGKYGDEGEKLLFKVLNNGDFLSKVDDQTLAEKDSYGIISQIAKRGLRYDLTVPMARYVVMHQNELSFPFKRYQIQPVWRADRPQKGRYQEFYQCDVDIVGSDSLMYEAELVQIYDEVFHKLGLDVTIRLNNRKLLTALAAYAGIPEKITSMTVAIDKLDKIGWDGIKKELAKDDIQQESIDRIITVLQTRDIDEAGKYLSDTDVGKLGMKELKQVMSYLEQIELHNRLDVDITLARGLDYYTGCIFEVVSNEAQMGSIGGGGRYDDLTSIFGMKDTSGVGVSFGAERIYDIMEELDKFPAEIEQYVKVIVIAFDQDQHIYAYQVANEIRQAGIPADIYPTPAKLKKQLKYANDRNIPFVILIGEEELKSGTLTVKNMVSGEQTSVERQEIVDYVNKI